MNKSLLLAAALLTFAACDSKYPDHSIVVNSTDALVQTQQGTLSGYIEDGIYTFKGIRYAKAKRFEAPQDPDSWEGVQTALYYGPQCHQAPRRTWEDDAEAFLYQWDDGTHSDDCQYLNVWTSGINDGKKRPVMVWIHGGGFAMGAGSELPFYDGTNLAKKDVVLVNLNHRLNFLGYLDLSEYGEKYKYSGVAGIMDLVKALEWIHNNIEAFGGDPGNVTIFGQSGGGGKSCTLMGTPSAKGLFHRAIIESGSTLRLAEKEDSRAMARRIVENLGLNEKTIDKIQEIPYPEFLEAASQAVYSTSPERASFYKGYGAGMWCMPVVDGEIIPYQLNDPRLAEISKGVPTIIGFNYVEGRMMTGAFGLADLRHSFGDTNQYMYIFAKPSPLMEGSFGTNHCAEMPFVFNNIWLGRFMVGADKSAYKLADFMSNVWVSFAKDGNPDVKGFHWEAYDPETTPVVVFNDKTKTVHKDDGQFWEDMKNFKRPVWDIRKVVVYE